MHCYSKKNTSCPFVPDMSRFHFVFPKRCVCTDVKYIHQQGFSIAIEEMGWWDTGTWWVQYSTNKLAGNCCGPPCRPDCPCRSALMSSSPPPSHRPVSLTLVRGDAGSLRNILTDRLLASGLSVQITGRTQLTDQLHPLPGSGQGQRSRTTQPVPCWSVFIAFHREAAQRWSVH